MYVNNLCLMCGFQLEVTLSPLQTQSEAENARRCSGPDLFESDPDLFESDPGNSEDDSNGDLLDSDGDDDAERANPCCEGAASSPQFRQVSDAQCWVYKKKGRRGPINKGAEVVRPS